MDGRSENAQGSELKMAPPPPHYCQECAVIHAPEEPHDKDSLYYGMMFHVKTGRWPTWSDAWAHCTPKVREGYRAVLCQILQESGREIPSDLLQAS